MPLLLSRDFSSSSASSREEGHLPVSQRPQSFVTATVFAPTHSNGTVLPFPPIHVHHAHVRREPLDPVSNSLFLQTHGDSSCLVDEGGHRCYFETWPLPFARRLPRTGSLW